MRARLKTVVVRRNIKATLRGYQQKRPGCLEARVRSRPLDWPIWQRSYDWLDSGTSRAGPAGLGVFLGRAWAARLPPICRGVQACWGCDLRLWGRLGL